VVWSSQLQTVTYKAVALSVIKPEVASGFYNTFLCSQPTNTCGINPGCTTCFVSLMTEMLYNGAKSPTIAGNADKANIQIFDANGYRNGWVGEDDGQGPWATDSQTMVSSGIQPPYGSDPYLGISTNKGYVSNYEFMKITCKGTANNATTAPYAQSDLQGIANRIANRFVNSNFLAWRITFYTSARNAVIARCRVTINEDTAMTLMPDFIPPGGLLLDAVDGTYPYQCSATKC